MTLIVPPADAIAAVGLPRHHDQHWGRAVSAAKRVYILHSQQCLDLYGTNHDVGVDLRDCPFSLALDNGIDVEAWVEDLPVQLRIEGDRLLPVDEQRCLTCGCVEERACEGGCYWAGPALCSSCA